MLPLSELPDSENFIQKYTDALLQQIKYYSQILEDKEIKTIYFGGGTPLSLGKNNIKKIIAEIQKNFNLENMEEISFELNPNPYDEIFDFITDINKSFKDFFRIRFSFGIQSFDDKILKETGRDYYFNYLTVFLRQLQKIKQLNNVFNFDFICFGKFNKDKKGNEMLWDTKKQEFFQNFVGSSFADSFSIYTLELFPGSFWFDQKNEIIKDEQIQENIYQEFEFFKEILAENGYRRYEISNFALPGKQSIHNKQYWTMGNYLGLGIGAHSFLSGVSSSQFLQANKINQDCEGIRFETNKSWQDFFSGKFIDIKDLKYLDKNDILIEKFFLELRTMEGITNISSFKEILIDDFIDEINYFQKNGFCIFFADSLKLTDKGMDVYNTIISQLLK